MYKAPMAAVLELTKPTSLLSPTAEAVLPAKMTYSRKKKKNREVEDMEFPGVLKKEHVEIPGVN